MELPSSEILSSLLSGDVAKLWDHPRSKVKPFLPFICKAVFDHVPPIIPDQDAIWSRYQKALHSLLYDFEVVNRLKKYLQLDFAELRHDALKEQQLMKKLDPDERRTKRESSLVSNMEHMVTVEFERGCVKRRFRLVLSEILRIISQVLSNSNNEISVIYIIEVPTFLHNVSVCSFVLHILLVDNINCRR